MSGDSYVSRISLMLGITANFNQFRICVTDFRESGGFLVPPSIHELPQKIPIPNRVKIIAETYARNCIHSIIKNSKIYYDEE